MIEVLLNDGEIIHVDIFERVGFLNIGCASLPFSFVLFLHLRMVVDCPVPLPL